MIYTHSRMLKPVKHLLYLMLRKKMFPIIILSSRLIASINKSGDHIILLLLLIRFCAITVYSSAADLTHCTMHRPAIRDASVGRPARRILPLGRRWPETCSSWSRTAKRASVPGGSGRTETFLAWTPGRRRAGHPDAAWRFAWLLRRCACTAYLQRYGVGRAKSYTATTINGARIYKRNKYKKKW